MFPRRSRSLDPFLLFLPSIMITSLPRLAPRTYRYTLDLHGQLFLSSTPHKTFTSAHRDPRFLATFFRRLRPLDPLEVDPADGFVYRWVSECLGERNLLYSVCGKTPIVFTRLEEEKEQSTPSPSRSNYHNDVTRGTSYRLTVCGGGRQSDSILLSWLARRRRASSSTCCRPLEDFANARVATGDSSVGGWSRRGWEDG